MNSYIKRSQIENTLKDEKWISLILFFICISQFILIPLYGSLPFFETISRMLWIIILLLGIISMTLYKRGAIFFAIIPVLLGIFSMTSIFSPTPYFLLMEFLLSIFSLIIFITLVLVRIFADGQVTGYRIVGSVVVYLLLAQLWALTYTYLYKYFEEAYQLTFVINEKNLHATFLYFSYTTLTTSGFGDIIPVNPIVRSVVQVESIVGILYPVLLIGRLVSGATGSKKRGSGQDND